MTVATGTSALVVAAVSAILKDLLTNHVVRSSMSNMLGDVTISLRPPDQKESGGVESARINLALYRITPNTSWRAHDAMPGAGLTLDLHYLLSAYAGQDLQTELLLGHAMQAFASKPLLDGDTIRQALVNGADGPLPQALATPQLVEQLERSNLEILPEFPGLDELARLWSAWQSRYQPSLAYCVRNVPAGALP